MAAGSILITTICTSMISTTTTFTMSSCITITSGKAKA